MRIIAIGGGDVGLRETLSIDRELIRQASGPRLLFVPTASEDAEDYVQRFRHTYEGEGCSVDVLRLYSEDDGPSARKKLMDADFVYVGGGNTKRMLALWKHVGFEEALREYIADDRPVGGLSAGAICWFRVGNSDWPIHEGVPNQNTAALPCLGLVDLAICPHTRDEGFRLAEFTAMMQTERGAGLGLDDGAAIQIVDDTYRILASQPNSFAHRLYRQGDCVEHEIVAPHDDFRPLDVFKDVERPL